MYKLVLLRHGESIWNAQNKFAGWSDIKLSEKGEEQAKAAGRVLKEQGFVFDLAFSSVLKRAIQTTVLVLQEMGLSHILVEQSWRLNERHYGALQGVGKKEAVKKFGEEQVQIWRRSYNVRPPAFALRQAQGYGVAKAGVNEPLSESLADVVDRVLPYWQDKIALVIQQGKRVLISAHGNSIRALVKIFDDISDKDIEAVNIPIAIPLVYELDDDLKPVRHYYLGDVGAVEAAIKTIADETKT